MKFQRSERPGTPSRRPGAGQVLAASWLCVLIAGGGVVAAAAGARSARPAAATGTGDRGGTSQSRLVTGRRITVPPVGTTAVVGGMPVRMILSPGGDSAVVTDAGFKQFLSAVNTSTGQVTSSVPFDTTGSLFNGLYYGLTLVPDAQGGGATVYASQGIAGAVVIYRLANGQLSSLNLDIPTGITSWCTGLAADNRGYLYAADRGKGIPFLRASLGIYDRISSKLVGSLSFNEDPTLSNFPLSVAARSDGSQVYVASERDGGVYVINATQPSKPVGGRPAFIPTGRNPDDLLLNKSQSLLYVANGGSDTVSVINTTTNSVKATIPLSPTTVRMLPGASPTGLALSPREDTLYVTLGDMNAVALISTANLQVQGYVPVGWYPTAVVAPPDGKHLLVANGNGSEARNPNPGFDWLNPDTYDNPVPNQGYILNLLQGNVQTIPLPISSDTLKTYTQQVLANNSIPATPTPPPNPLARIGLQAGKIQHVIYIVKENRSYDQILGDLKDTQGQPRGNGQADLAMYGYDPGTPGAPQVTPNQHALANQFVLLDNFYCAGGVSSEGWPWSTQGQANEYVQKTSPYVNRLPTLFYVPNYDFEGQNDGYPTGGFPAKDPNGDPLSLLYPNGAPKVPDVAEAAGGHIWSLVKRAGLSYRNYGFFYTSGGLGIVPDNYPDHPDLQPAGEWGQPPANNVSDWYFRRFDLNFADSDAPADDGAPPATKSYGPYNAPRTSPKRTTTSRFQEWNHEFQQLLAANKVPNFMMVRFGRDHSQGLTPSKADTPVHSPAAMIADNDYAVGQLVAAVRGSPIWNSTAIFIIEDDAQFGPDHVDAHRSTCYVASPWIKQQARGQMGTIDSTFYNTVSVLRTMELLLGLPPMNQYDATASPIVAPWDMTGPSNQTPFQAIPPPADVIREYNPTMASLKPNDYRYRLAQLSAKMNFKNADSIPDQLLNEVLWTAAHGPNVPMPPPRIHSITCLAPPTPVAPKDDDD